ncbi:hypothetical protein DENIS_0445 [Desulfonema ishimotonii]|uniref:PpiC domain-containing protein n=1 Tax=Desulfonema ishimotonii TaxID=45657 RepID=A0A401FRB4_9BACT|nr:peptidylprolyl isomerase [Desulfonema ishimotonii]GBC59506.1 hypothetical protein DENIS_0445 [Desulfonema ishimotonii]
MNVRGICRGAVLTALALTLTALPGWAEKKPAAEGNIALVNGKAITQSAFDQEMGPVLQRMKMTGKPVADDQLAEVRKKTLENMIDRELLYQDSSQKGITVDDAAVDKQLASFKARFPEEAQFKQALEKMNLTEDIIKKQIREQLTIQELVDTQIIPKIKTSDADIRKYYDEHPDFFKQSEQVKASHILIKLDANADEAQKAEARKKIEDIQKKLKEGGDFAALAKEASDCPSGKSGGDLGSFGRGQMVRPFEEAAFAAKPGEITDIVETRFGYHLIRVDEKKPATTIAFEEARPKIEGVLKREGVRKGMSEYIDALKKKAKIERFL